jgi:hypothetical protein
MDVGVQQTSDRRVRRGRRNLIGDRRMSRATHPDPRRRGGLVGVLSMLGLLLVACGSSGAQPATIAGRVVADGVPGAGTITSVGRFLPGGPINDNAAFKAFTEPGKVLDPNRLLVGSTSNFGAPLAMAGDMPGSILSIDASGPQRLDVPPDFASSGTQATALDGRVDLYSAQASAFMNNVTNPQAVTAGQPGVSNILDLSINNAFGRLWPANAPQGLSKEGTETILDPGGMPLANAPDTRAGGVFAGTVTGRQPAQVVPGSLSAGAVATAFIGRGLDDPRRAVFAVVTADGAIVQAHTQQGVDGLAPAGTITDMRGNRNAAQLHAGALLKYYTADPVLYVSDPVANQIVAVSMPKDDVGKVRRMGTVEHYKSPAFDMPVDLAPTLSEANARDWSSNTTLAELADIYVLNRGNNTITRMKVDGTVIGTRKVTLVGGKSLGSAKVNGIATSVDGTKVYVTVTGRVPGTSRDGAVLELPAFTR